MEVSALGVNWTYCDYFAVYINIESLCCTAETNTVVCQKKKSFSNGCTKLPEFKLLLLSKDVNLLKEKKDC